MKRAYFMTVIDGVFCLGRACDKQTRDAFQSSRAVITLQSLACGPKNKLVTANKLLSVVTMHQIIADF